jgi:hypothetical protein
MSNRKEYKSWITIIEEHDIKHGLSLTEKDDILMNYAISLYNIQKALKLYPRIRFNRFLDHLTEYERAMQPYCDTEHLLEKKIKKILFYRPDNELCPKGKSWLIRNCDFGSCDNCKLEDKT